MVDAVGTFKREYMNSFSLEEGMLELKRKGFTEMDAIKVMMQLLHIDLVEADRVVRESDIWTKG
ncbi:hypothetical protein [Spirosoma flavum]|uniref:hypothetical protein n=1 Tax=Spirosoma flavum TaxID=2048557 RepID=UPI0036D34B64